MWLYVTSINSDMDQLKFPIESSLYKASFHTIYFVWSECTKT